MINYQKIYDTLIERGRLRSKEKGLFRHRIIPGHEGGIYVEQNTTYLTIKEHRIVHLLRYKIFSKVEDKWASHFMKGKGIGPWNQGKTYIELLGEERALIANEKRRKASSGKNNPRYGAILSKETREKIGKNWLGKKNPGQSERMKLNNPMRKNK